MFRLRQLLTLTRLTAVEAIRQPICLLLAASCILFIAASPLTVVHKFGEDGKFARDSSLAFHFVFGLLIAGYSAGSSLAREFRTGTASAVLSKPVSRTTLLLAKFFGIACVIILFSACVLPATLLSERIDEKFCMESDMTGYITDWHTGILLVAAPFAALLFAGIVNYTSHRPFGSTAFIFLLLCVLTVFVMSGFFDRLGRFAPFDFRVQWRILPAGILITLALLVLSAIAVSLSTRLGTGSTLTVSAGIFMVGLMSDYLFGRHAAVSAVSAFLYRIVPNWQHFWASDALSGGGRIPWHYLLHATVYAAAYCAGILCLGMLSFRHTEVK